jgi:hypothetical protein
MSTFLGITFWKFTVKSCVIWWCFYNTSLHDPLSNGDSNTPISESVKPLRLFLTIGNLNLPVWDKLRKHSLTVIPNSRKSVVWFKSRTYTQTHRTCVITGPLFSLMRRVDQSSCCVLIQFYSRSIRNDFLLQRLTQLSSVAGNHKQLYTGHSSVSPGNADLT